MARIRKSYARPQHIQFQLIVAGHQIIIEYVSRISSCFERLERVSVRLMRKVYLEQKLVVLLFIMIFYKND